MDVPFVLKLLLLPAADCLFQVQDAKLFKAFSRVGITGLLALFNLADADNVKLASGKLILSIDKLKQ